MKKLLLSLLLAVLGIGLASAEKTTYVFNSKSWGATCDNEAANWTSGKDGGQYTTDQGIQITTTQSGANATSPVSFENVNKITVTYCTNTKKGAGTIKLNVGDSSFGDDFTVTAPSSGGTTLKEQDFTSVTPLTGKVKITVGCTTNSIYIYSITIYTGDVTPSTDPVISASNVEFGTAFTGETKTLNVTAANLTEDITLTWRDGGKFTCEPSQLATTGGELTITLVATTGTEISDELTLTSGTTTKTVTVSANRVVITGDGSYTNPFTVADVIALNNNKIGDYWVKGIILGYYNNNKIDNTGDSNIVLGDNTSATTLSDDAIAVQLPNNSVMRVELNVKDNSSNVGKTVLVYGSLEKYFSNNPGVKNTADFILVADLDVTVGETGYTTLYYGHRNLVVPAGISGWTFTASGTDLDATESYKFGDVIPAGEAVVLFTATAGNYTLKATEEKPAAVAENYLHGTDVAGKVTTEGTPYILGVGTHGVGFYQAAADGGKTFNNGAHKAYLEIPATIQAPARILLNLGETDGINVITVDEDDANGAMYNVLGQPVNDSYKGFVIKNGKKVINK